MSQTVDRGSLRETRGVTMPDVAGLFAQLRFCTRPDPWISLPLSRIVRNSLLSVAPGVLEAPFQSCCSGVRQIPPTQHGYLLNAPRSSSRRAFGATRG